MFKVGDEVVCVLGFEEPEASVLRSWIGRGPPQEGETFVVVGIMPCLSLDSGLGLELDKYKMGICFCSWHFRKVQRKEGMEQLKKLLDVPTPTPTPTKPELEDA
jgi:hypothetical protein